MARFGIIAGLALCVLTAFALFGTLDKAPLLFVPMMLGIPILFSGVVALNPHRRRFAIGSAAAIGVVGLVIGLGQGIRLLSLWQRTESVNLHSVRIVALMVSICLVFLVAYGWSGMFWGRTLESAQKRSN